VRPCAHAVPSQQQGVLTMPQTLLPLPYRNVMSFEAKAGIARRRDRVKNVRAGQQAPEGENEVVALLHEIGFHIPARWL